MKLETYLNAFAAANNSKKYGHKGNRRDRQWRAFRARILQMYDRQQSRIEEKDARIERILSISDAHDLSHELAMKEKDEEIARLRNVEDIFISLFNYLKENDYFPKDYFND